jgi:hypothetical protein
MSAGKLIAYIAAGIIIFFSILFIWGSFGEQGGGFNWILVGIIGVVIGFGIIWFAARSKTQAGQAGQNVTLKIDLPANVNIDTLKCKSCGGSLTMDNIKMVAGAPVVTCPYCKSTYQLTEEPKW